MFTAPDPPDTRGRTIPSFVLAHNKVLVCDSRYNDPYTEWTSGAFGLGVSGPPGSESHMWNIPSLNAPPQPSDGCEQKERKYHIISSNKSEKGYHDVKQMLVLGGRSLGAPDPSVSHRYTRYSTIYPTMYSTHHFLVLIHLFAAHGLSRAT